MSGSINFLFHLKQFDGRKKETFFEKCNQIIIMIMYFEGGLLIKIKPICFYFE